MIDQYPELRKCIEGGNSNAVKNAIKLGEILFKIKDSVKDKKESWLDFIEDNFSLSTRTCQNYMKLAKTPIHENHYKEGTEKVLKLLRDGYDLSNPILDVHCQGCKAYNQERSFCILICVLNNQTGDCPCTQCDSKSDCPEESCLKWDEWERSF